MKRVIAIAVALMAIAATSSFAALGLYDLGAGAGPAGMSTDGSVMAYNLAGTNLWSRATASSANISATYTTIGVGLKGTTVVVGADDTVAGKVYRWDGNAAGTGTWSGPLISGTTAWQANCIAATTGNVFIGGNTTASTGSKLAYRYKESSGFLNGCTSLAFPTSPAQGYSDGYVYDISDGGAYAGRCNFVAKTGSGGIRAGMATNVGTGALQGMYAYPSWGPTVSASRAWGISRDGKYASGWSYANSGVGDGTGVTGVPIEWNLSLTNGTPPIMVPLMSGYVAGSVECLDQAGAIGYGYQQTVAASARRGEAFVYDRVANTSTDLATYLSGLGVVTTGWTLTEVVDVSGDNKVLTGYGQFGGAEHGWVIVIPEPGSILALAVGLIGLVGLRRRTR